MKYFKLLVAILLMKGDFFIYEFRAQSTTGSQPLKGSEILLPEFLTTNKTAFEFSALAKWRNENDSLLLVPTLKKRYANSADYLRHSI